MSSCPCCGVAHDTGRDEDLGREVLCADCLDAGCEKGWGCYVDKDHADTHIRGMCSTPGVYDRTLAHLTALRVQRGDRPGPAARKASLAITVAVRGVVYGGMGWCGTGGALAYIMNCYGDKPVDRAGKVGLAIDSCLLPEAP
jgi:hypothetical protein